MNPTTLPDSPTRQILLDQIASITTMQPGSLAEEYREHPSPDGGDPLRLGPYLKHQVWQDGRNLSRRVPAAEAAILKLDIEAAKRFHQLTAQLAQINIHNTIALRAAEAAEATAAGTARTGTIAEKKTSNPNASRKNTGKRNSFSPKHAKDSPKRKNNKT